MFMIVTSLEGTNSLKVTGYQSISVRGHTVKSYAHNFRVDAYTSISLETIGRLVV